MGTIITIILGVFLASLFMFNKDRKKENKGSYDSMPPEIQNLIKNKEAQKLAEIIHELEFHGDALTLKHLLNAIESKGLGFFNEVGEYRKKLRNQ